MASLDSEDQIIERNRRTLFLLLAGAFALLIPLFVLLYLRMTEATISLPNNGGRTFVRRDPADRPKVAAAPAPQVPMNQVTTSAGGTPSAPTGPQVGGSLDFIKGGSEYYPPEQQQQAAAPAKTEAAPAPKAEAPKQEVAAKKPPAKTGPRPFMQPKLNTSLGNRSGGGGFSGRTQFSGQQGGMPQQGQGMPPGGMPSGMPPGGMPDVSGMMKNMPGGGAGMPDVGGMLQGITGGGEKKK